MAHDDTASKVAQLYGKIADKDRLPYRLSHARQPNDSTPHEDEVVLTYARERVLGRPD